MYKKIAQYIVYSLIFLIPLFFLPFTSEPFGLNKGYLFLLLTAGGFFVWLAGMIFKDKKLVFRWSRLDWAVLGFIFVLSLGVFFSKDKAVSFWGPYGRTWPSLLALIGFGAFYGLASNNIEVKNGLKVFLASSALVVLSSYLAVFNVFKLLADKINLPLPQLFFNRGFNLAGMPLEGLSVFMAFLSVMIVAILSFGRQRFLKKSFLYLLLLGCLGLLALIDFSLAWLVLIISLTCFLGLAFWQRIFKEDINKLALSLLVLTFGLVFFFANPLLGFLSQSDFFNQLPREVALTQQASWRIALNSLRAEPLFGSGLGNFTYNFSRFKPANFWQDIFWQIRMAKSGNFTAELMATSGALGFLSWLGMILLFFWTAYRLVLKEKRFSKIILPLALIALLAGQFVYSQNFVLAFSFWLILALAMADFYGKSKEKTIDLKKVPELGLVFGVLFWVGMVGFAFLVFSGSKQYLADAYYKKYLENPQQNLSQLERASDLSQKRVNYHVLLANAYLTSFKEEIAKENPDVQKVSNLVALAVGESRKAQEVSPHNVAGQEISAIIYRDIQGLAQGADDWAVKSFESGLELEPDNPLFLVELAKIYLSKGNEARAKELLERAVEVKPNYLEARFELGRFYYNTGQYDKAEGEFLAAIVIFPNHSNSLYSLALIYQRKGDKETTLQFLERVLSLNPDNAAVKDKISEVKRMPSGSLPLASQAEEEIPAEPAESALEEGEGGE